MCHGAEGCSRRSERAAAEKHDDTAAAEVVPVARANEVVARVVSSVECGSEPWVATCSGHVVGGLGARVGPAGWS